MYMYMYICKYKYMYTECHACPPAHPPTRARKLAPARGHCAGGGGHSSAAQQPPPSGISPPLIPASAHTHVCVCVCVCVCARARARARTTSMQTSKQALLHVATVRCVHTHTDTQQPQAHTHGDMPHLHAAIKNQEENLDLEILVRILSCSLLQLLQHVFVFLC